MFVTWICSSKDSNSARMPPILSHFALASRQLDQPSIRNRYCPRELDLNLNHFLKQNIPVASSIQPSLWSLLLPPLYKAVLLVLSAPVEHGNILRPVISYQTLFSCYWSLNHLQLSRSPIRIRSSCCWSSCWFSSSSKPWSTDWRSRWTISWFFANSKNGNCNY